MFHSGDLQSGITSAIQQQKLVTCFVYEDGNVESDEWEKTWLREIASLIAEKSVVLRLRLHSQEAGFLSAFCPMTVAPSIAVIDNGKVVIKIEAPIEHDDWNAQLETALRIRDTPTTIAQPPSQTSQAPDSTAGSSNPAVAAVAPDLQSLLPGRAERLEADQASKQAEEKAARIARSEARRKEVEAAQKTARSGKAKELPSSSSSQPPKARTDWIREQAKRKDEAKRERERILQQIQSDREERRHKAAIAKQAVAPAEPIRPVTGASSVKPDSACALQIRLLDGSSIRSHFAANATLRGEVRSSISQRAPDVVDAYTFRQIFAPQPSRTIQDSEEDRPLHAIGLAPSATLVLVQAATKSAPSSGVVSLLFRLFSPVLSLFAMILTLFTSRRSGNAEDESEKSEPSGSTTGADVASASSTTLRTRTLADRRAEQGAQDKTTEFYNGNSSAFEGRKDDDDG